MGPLSHLWSRASLLITLSFLRQIPKRRKHFGISQILTFVKDKQILWGPWMCWCHKAGTLYFQSCWDTKIHLLSEAKIKLQFHTFYVLPLAYQWFLHFYKFQKETFCQNSICWILHVLFTLFFKFLNNYRREARFDFSKCKSPWPHEGIAPSHSNEEREQRATKSRGVTHFINCVGSRSCPLEKSVDLIKLPRTLGGGSGRK